MVSGKSDDVMGKRVEGILREQMKETNQKDKMYKKKELTTTARQLVYLSGWEKKSNGLS